MVSQLLSVGETIDRVIVPADSEALAAACIAAFEDAHALGLIRRVPIVSSEEMKEQGAIRSSESVAVILTAK